MTMHQTDLIKLKSTGLNYIQVNLNYGLIWSEVGQ